MVKIFENFHWGPDLYVLNVDIKGIRNQKETVYQCSIRGNNESQATGSVAAIVAESLYTKKFPTGVYYLEQLFESEELLSKLKDCFEFSTNGQAQPWSFDQGVAQKAGGFDKT
ncbi:MAG: hypothetical protein L3J69_19360 [Desulfobacula sp.]|nr:hypothetical protein [Desulfobacula sp.]